MKPLWYCFFSAFLLTRPSRGATRKGYRDFDLDLISTHTPLAGRDPPLLTISMALMYFYSHAPRGARPVLDMRGREMIHFYSHAPRGARLEGVGLWTIILLFLLTRPSRGATFSPRSCFSSGEFLLTRPSRGATIFPHEGLIQDIISTHTPLAGRDVVRSTSKSSSKISTHTPLAGRDSSIVRDACSVCDFYSHAPRGARHASPGSTGSGTLF